MYFNHDSGNAQFGHVPLGQDNGMGLHGLLRDKYPMLAKNLNKQYIIEGLSAGFLVVVGSMGCILLTVCAIKV